MIHPITKPEEEVFVEYFLRRVAFSAHHNTFENHSRFSTFYLVIPSFSSALLWIMLKIGTFF